MWIVIEHEWQVNRSTNTAIVLDDCRLGWLLKVRQDYDDGICAAFLCFERKFDGNLCTVVAGTVDYRHAPANHISGEAEDAFPFFRFHGNEFSTGARDH